MAVSKRQAHETALRRLQTSPAEFRASLAIDTDGGEVRLGDAMDLWQREDFEALDPAWRHVAFRSATAPAPPKQRAWLERPRGHSKTADLAVMICWALFAAPRRLVGLAAAADKDQARLLRDAVAKLVAGNPWLRQYLDVQQFRILNTHTDSTLEIISSDAPSSYGTTPDFIIADEITHWGRRELFDSLISSAAKRKHCLFLVICNAGFSDSWQWELREAIRGDSMWYFHALDGPQATWIGERALAEQRRLLPRIAFERLWLNRWSTGSGDALDPQDIDAAIRTASTPHRTPAAQHPSPGWVYFAGVDLGLARDATAVVVLGRHCGHVEILPSAPRPRRQGAIGAMLDLGLFDADAPAGWQDDEPEYRTHDATGRYAVCEVEMWRPGRGQRVSLTDVEAAIRRLNDRYKLTTTGYDPWQAAMLAERLRAAGVVVEPVEFQAHNLKGMASVVLETFAERNIDLPDHRQLVSDLRRLRVAEKSYGVRLESPRGPDGHGDAATSLAIALLVASRATAAAPQLTLTGPLVCWP